MSLSPAPEGGASEQLLGCAENALGLRDWLEGEGHQVVSTSAREGDDLTRELADAEVLVTTPFWPVYVDRQMLEAAPKLKLVLTAGVGSDPVDLKGAAERELLGAEQTGSNVVSVAEHAVMQLLALVRNYVPAYQQVVDGRWDIGEIAARSWDLERKTVGIYGAGAIGQLIAIRLKAFDVETLHCKRTRLQHPEEAVIGARGRDDDGQRRAPAGRRGCTGYTGIRRAAVRPARQLRGGWSSAGDRLALGLDPDGDPLALDVLGRVRLAVVLLGQLVDLPAGRLAAFGADDAAADL